ncbi:ABC transporter permease, partial [Komagataeibacter sp. FXV3]|nr:ABC transporter permease [Komagataeibacter sp. FXV3]
MSAPTQSTSTGPWRQAARNLARTPSAMVALGVLAAVTMACLLAPFYAHTIARTNPFQSTVAGTIMLDGHEVDIMQPNDNPLHLGLSPIGPTWRTTYMLGADNQGRDVMARLLYGGRNSLLISAGAAIMCLLLAAGVG